MEAKFKRSEYSQSVKICHNPSGYEIVMQKYEEAHQEFRKDLDIFLDDLDWKYQLLFLLKIENREGVFFAMAQKNKAQAISQAVDLVKIDFPLAQNRVANYVEAFVDEQLAQYFVQSSLNFLDKAKFKNDRDKDRVKASRNFLNEELNLKKCSTKKDIAFGELDFPVISLIKDVISSVAKQIFILKQETSREAFYFTREAIENVRQQIKQKQNSSNQKSEKEKISLAKKFICQKKNDIISSEINYSSEEELPDPQIEKLHMQENEVVKWQFFKEVKENQIAEKIVIKTQARSTNAIATNSLTINLGSILHKKDGIKKAEDFIDYQKNKQGSNFKVADGVYGQKDDILEEKLQQNIKNTFIFILAKIAAEPDLNFSKDKVLAIIEEAKKRGGVYDISNDEIKNFSETQILNNKSFVAQGESGKDHVLISKAQKFSSFFQAECKKCGIYSSHEDHKAVGLRLVFIPDDVVEYVKKQMEQQIFEQLKLVANQNLETIKKDITKLISLGF